MVKVEGIKRLQKFLNSRAKQDAEGLYNGIKKAALYLQRQSQKIVPVDTGALKNSARTLENDSSSKFKPSFRVVYGMKYAIFVHEILRYRHKKGKSAKFLEIPLREKRKDMIEIIRMEIRKKRKKRTKKGSE